MQVSLLLQDKGHKMIVLTFPFFHHSSRLRQSKALHCFISLPQFRTRIYIFQDVMRCFHQHTAIKCMAFLSLGLICPSNSINFEKQIRRGVFCFCFSKLVIQSITTVRNSSLYFLLHVFSTEITLTFSVSSHDIVQ